MGKARYIMTEGQRTLTEFVCYCDEPYIYIWLNTKITGNHIIVCPVCSHKHYRVIKNGHISDERCNNSIQHKETIRPMRSAAQKEQRKFGKIARFKQMIASGHAPYGG